MRSYPYVSGGTAQVRIPVIMRSSTDGSLLAGLASTAMTVNYQINGSTTGVTVGAGTAGTWGSGHWVAASHSSGGDPKAGHYEFGVPAACFQTDNVVVKIAFSAAGAITTVVTFSVGGDLGRADSKIDTIHGKLPSSSYLAGTSMSDGRQTQITGSVGSVVSGVALSTSERTAVSGVIWDTLTSGFATAGSIGKRIVDYLTGDIFARLGAPAGASVSADVAAVKAKTDNLPASPAAVGSAMTLTAGTITSIQTGLSTLDAAGVRAALGMSAANLDTQIGTLATASSITTLGGYIDTEVASILAIVGSGTHGNAALLTAIQGVSAGSGLTAQQTRDAMALALGEGVTAAEGSVDALIAGVDGGPGATVQVLPLQATVSSNRYTTAGGTILPLTMAQHESIDFVFAVVDEAGDPVDMTGRTVRMLAHDDAGAVVWTRETGGNGIAISGSQVTVTVSETQSATVASYSYKLRDITGKKVLATGTFQVKLAPVVGT